MLLLSLLLACGNECSYYERCDGNTLLVCGSGPDQIVNRKEIPTECTAPNEVCVEVGSENATCAHVAEPCTGTAATCDGTVILICTPFSSALGLLGDETDQSFIQGTDCATAGQVCQDDGSGAACVSP